MAAQAESWFAFSDPRRYEEISAGLGVKYSAFHFQTWLNLSVWPNKQSIYFMSLWNAYILITVICRYGKVEIVESFYQINKLWVYIGWWCHYAIHTVRMTDLAQLNSIIGICCCVFAYYIILVANLCNARISLTKF